MVKGDGETLPIHAGRSWAMTAPVLQGTP